MALIYCTNCGKQVSSLAEKCPHCGYVFQQNVPQSKTVSNSILNAMKNKKLWIFAGAAVAVLLIILLISGKSGEKYFQMAKEATDDNLRIEYLTKAVKKGHAEAMFNLAYIKLNANPSPEEMSEAFELMHKSAKGGYLPAQWTYGIALINGNYGPAKNVSEGYKWLEMSAANGFGESQKTLGLAYYAGNLGVPRDLEKANYWMAKAAAQNVEGAESCLHVMNGLGPDGRPMHRNYGLNTLAATLRGDVMNLGSIAAEEAIYGTMGSFGY